MFDMTTASSPHHHTHIPMTPQSSLKYSPHHNPHSPTIMSSPCSTPNSMADSSSSKSNSTKDNTLFGSKCKRKINFSHLGIPKGHQPPATVARRNARERNRVKQVNNGFSALKQHIPLSHRSKKMSKVETLRCAVDYIKNLKDMLDLNLLGENVFANFHTEQLLSPTTSSEDPSSPSYTSEASSYIASSNTTNNATNNTNTPAHYDYENYEPVSPEDEELLDCISWWQQS